MNWLIITDNDDFLNDITQTLKSNEKHCKINSSDFSSENLKQIKTKVKLSDLSACVIFSDAKKDFSQEEQNLLSLYTGIFINEEIYIFTNVDFINSHAEMFKNSIKHVKDSDALFSFLNKKQDSLVTDDLRRKAKKKLISKGIPFTPDCFALYIEKNKPEIFNLFISAGIDVNSRDETGTPMLNIAIRNDNEDFAFELLNLGAEINAVSVDRGYTALMDAVWRGNETLTEFLVNKGAELNTINKEGQNNLVLAVGADRDKICKILVEHGADPDVKDMMGMSAYGYATLFRKQRLIEILQPYHKE